MRLTKKRMVQFLGYVKDYMDMEPPVMTFDTIKEFNEVVETFFDLSQKYDIVWSHPPRHIKKLGDEE
jgi:hypothetical protein